MCVPRPSLDHASGLGTIPGGGAARVTCGLRSSASLVSTVHVLKNLLYFQFSLVGVKRNLPLMKTCVIIVFFFFFRGLKQMEVHV